MNKFRLYLESQNYSPTSIESMLVSVMRFKKWTYNEVLEDVEIGYSDIIKYIKTLQKRQLKPRSINMYLRAIKKYFSFLIITKRYKKENPVVKITIHGVKRSKMLDVLSEIELMEIFRNYKGQGLRFDRNKCLLGFILFQGLGSQELSKLKIQHVNLDGLKISVEGGLRSNSRELAIIDQQLKYLVKYMQFSRLLILKNKNMKSDLLFFSMGTGILLKNTIQNLMRELKIKHHYVRNIKQLRASVIANWTKTYNLREAQYMAGHKYVSSTETYLLSDMSDLQEEINKFHPLQ